MCLVSLFTFIVLEYGNGFLLFILNPARLAMSCLDQRNVIETLKIQVLGFLLCHPLGKKEKKLTVLKYKPVESSSLLDIFTTCFKVM